MNLTKNNDAHYTVSITDILDNDLNCAILNNIRKKMSEKNISREQLIKSLKNMGFDVKSINSYFPANDITASRKITLQWLIAICGILRITIDCLFVGTKYDDGESGDQDSKSLKNTEKDLLNSLFANNVDYFYDASNPIHNEAFKNLHQKYYCYYYSTSTTEKKVIIEANLDISIENSLYVINFHIGNRIFNQNTPPSENNTNSILIDKNYKGYLVISNKLQCCYCMMFGINIAELNMLVFRRLNSNANMMDSRVAQMVTVSSGENKFPTTIRFLLSCEKLEPHVVEKISAHLLMNRSTIDIQTENLHKIIENNPQWSELLKKCIDLQPKEINQVSSLKEGFIEVINDTINHALSKKELRELFSILRNSSIAETYNKTNKKVDDTVRQILYSEGHFRHNAK